MSTLGHRVIETGMSILIVDDSPDTRLLLKRSLDSAGYTSAVASSGDAALEALNRGAVDLVLLDIMMPGMTGLSLFQRIRESHPDVAVVFVTCVDDLDLAVRHVKNGAFDYVVKPITPARARRVVKEAMERLRTLAEDRRHRRALEEQVGRQAGELETRVRELKLLNRMFQANLSERFTKEEGADGDKGTRGG